MYFTSPPPNAPAFGMIAFGIWRLVEWKVSLPISVKELPRSKVVYRASYRLMRRGGVSRKLQQWEQARLQLHQLATIPQRKHVDPFRLFEIQLVEIGSLVVLQSSQELLLLTLLLWLSKSRRFSRRFSGRRSDPAILELVECEIFVKQLLCRRIFRFALQFPERTN